MQVLQGRNILKVSAFDRIGKGREAQLTGMGSGNRRDIGPSHGWEGGFRFGGAQRRQTGRLRHSRGRRHRGIGNRGQLRHRRSPWSGRKIGISNRRKRIVRHGRRCNRAVIGRG